MVQASKKTNAGCGQWSLWTITLLIAVAGLVVGIVAIATRHSSHSMVLDVSAPTARNDPTCLVITQCVDDNGDGTCNVDEPIVHQYQLCEPSIPPALEDVEVLVEDVSVNQKRIALLDTQALSCYRSVETLEDALNDTKHTHHTHVIELQSVDDTTTAQLTMLGTRTSILEQLDISKQQRLNYLHNNITQHHARLIALETHGSEPTVLVNDTWLTQLNGLIAQTYDLENMWIQQHVQLVTFNETQHSMKATDNTLKRGLILLHDNVTAQWVKYQQLAAVQELLHQEDLTLHMDLALLRSNITELSNDFQSHMHVFHMLQESHALIAGETMAQAQQMAHVLETMGQKQTMMEFIKGNVTAAQEQTSLILNHLNALQSVEQEYQLWSASVNQQLSDLHHTLLGWQHVSEQGVLSTDALTAQMVALEHVVYNQSISITAVEGQTHALQSHYITQNLTIHVMQHTINALSSHVSALQSETHHLALRGEAQGAMINALQLTNNETLTMLNMNMEDLITRTNTLDARESVVESDVAILQTDYAILQQHFQVHQADLDMWETKTNQLQYNQTLLQNQHSELHNAVTELQTLTQPWTILAPAMESDVSGLQSWRLIVDAHLAELAPLEQELQQVDASILSDVRAVNASCMIKTIQLEQRIEELESQLQDTQNQLATLQQTTTEPTPVVPNVRLHVCHAAYANELGQALFADGISVTRTAVGRYSIVFNAPMTHTHYPVFIQMEEGDNHDSLVDDIQAHVRGETRQTTGFSFHVVRQDKGNKNKPFYEDRAFNVQILCQQ